MKSQLEPLERLLLWKMIFLGYEPALSKTKPKLVSDARRRLLDMGLIEIEKRGRSSHLVLTDNAWLWASENLEAEISTRSYESGPILQTVLARLKVFLVMLKWHQKEWLLVSLLLCNAEIEDIDYVRMAQPPENAAFPPKQLDLLGIQYFFDRLQRDVTVHLKINGAVDDSHPSLTNDLFDLVTLERGCHGYSPRLFQGILQTQTTSGSTSVRN